MTAHLFVYGTLRPHADGAFGAEARLRLAQEARHLGAATIAGQLADLGRYPALLAGTGTVHGDVYALTAPAETFPWLDAYEGITGAESDEYVRTKRPVILTGGTELIAWVYLAKTVGARPIIVSGDWLAPARPER